MSEALRRARNEQVRALSEVLDRTEQDLERCRTELAFAKQILSDIQKTCRRQYVPRAIHDILVRYQSRS